MTAALQRGRIGVRPLVLLAVHDPITARLWELQFRAAGYQVVVRPSSEEAESAFLTSTPDLTVIDTLISQGRGAQLCQRLKGRSSAPILMVSDVAVAEDAVAAGADAFLTRPLEWEDLVVTAGDLLGIEGSQTRSQCWRTPTWQSPAVTALEEERQQLRARVEELEAEVNRLIVVNTDLDRFTADVAHDLAQPLLTTGGHLSILEFHAEALDPEARKSMRAAMDSVARMNSTLRALRHLSRTTMDTVTLAAVDLSDVVRQVIDDLAPAVASTGAELVVGELPVVEGDPALLARMISNLLANALKYSRPGIRPRVDITARHGDGGWSIRVDDNGIGIPGEHREEVFGAFVRLSPGADRPGSGLGLAIARRAAARHGATISIDNAPEGGARFVIDLPSPVAARSNLVCG